MSESVFGVSIRATFSVPRIVTAKNKYEALDKVLAEPVTLDEFRSSKAFFLHSEAEKEDVFEVDDDAMRTIWDEAERMTRQLVDSRDGYTILDLCDSLEESLKYARKYGEQLKQIQDAYEEEQEWNNLYAEYDEDVDI